MDLSRNAEVPTQTAPLHRLADSSSCYSCLHGTHAHARTHAHTNAGMSLAKKGMQTRQGQNGPLHHRHLVGSGHALIGETSRPRWTGCTCCSRETNLRSVLTNTLVPYRTHSRTHQHVHTQSTVLPPTPDVLYEGRSVLVGAKRNDRY